MTDFSDNAPLTFRDPLPTSVDVVVIGGGVIGTSTAWFLRQAGSSVLVCDKGRVAGEQSSRNWGWIRQQGRDAAEVPIAMDSVNLWESISREIGEDIGFTPAASCIPRAPSVNSLGSNAGCGSRNAISSTRACSPAQRSTRW